jgi:type IV pilus assembly protein PilB
MAKARGDFTKLLVQNKIVTSEQVAEARRLQAQTGAKLQDAIVKLGFASPEEVMRAIAEFHGLQFIDLSEVTIPQSVVELVPESVARENIVLPLAEENGAFKVIMSDPTDLDTVPRLQFILNQDIVPVLATREQIVEAIDRHYGLAESVDVDQMLLEFTDTSIDLPEPEATQSADADDSDAPIVRLVNLIIQEAISLRASDIHIEPFADRVRLRYRIDGVLVERDSPPRRLLDPILSRIKVMANIAPPRRPQPREGRLKRLLAPLLSRTKTPSNVAIAERPRPRDGRIKMQVEGRPFDLRVSILPTHHGESAVIRIPHLLGIQELGLDGEDSQRFQQILKRPSGLVLVTGPVGSGKTTTLYAALEQLNRPDRKIITAEDPVEYALPAGIAQCQVRHDLTVANALRDILRQGPDVIAVGEIRDRETARAAVEAALGGRLVLGTLPTTKDAASAIARLDNLRVPPSLIAGSVIAILAQRLVRVICPQCKCPDEPDGSEIEAAALTPDQLSRVTFMRGLGCPLCYHTGYRGRTAIFEILTMSPAVRGMTFDRAPVQAIRRQARLSGMRILLEAGVHKALCGITTLEEVLSVCHHELETDTGSGA